MQVKGGILYICFTGKYIKKYLVNITTKDQKNITKKKWEENERELGNARVKQIKKQELETANNPSTRSSGWLLALLKLLYWVSYFMELITHDWFKYFWKEERKDPCNNFGYIF